MTTTATAAPAGKQRTETHNGWAKILAAAIPLLVVGLVGWGTMAARVDNLQKSNDAKADQQLVVQQYQSILRELDALRSEVRELRGRR